jgi:beta-lactamase regulating signal transducer with metallopeptidase domain
LPQLSPEEIKVILLHELAHLRRWDDWTNLAQKIVKAVFFFHPRSLVD